MASEEESMLIKDRLEIPGEKKDDTVLRWLVAAGAGVFVAIWLQDLSQRYLALDFTQALAEFSLLLFLIFILMGAAGAAAGFLAKLLRQSFRLWVGCTLAMLIPTALFMVYSHLTMSRALLPIKTDFRQAAGCTSASARDCRSQLTAILDSRDAYLRRYGYTRIGSWHVTHDGVDCESVYLFTAGLAEPR